MGIPCASKSFPTFRFDLLTRSLLPKMLSSAKFRLTWSSTLSLAKRNSLAKDCLRWPTVLLPSTTFLFSQAWVFIFASGFQKIWVSFFFFIILKFPNNSGQSIPNRAEVKNAKGVKIYFDPVSTGMREKAVRKLVEKVLWLQKKNMLVYLQV